MSRDETAPETASLPQISLQEDGKKDEQHWTAAMEKHVCYQIPFWEFTGIKSTQIAKLWGNLTFYVKVGRTGILPISFGWQKPDSHKLTALAKLMISQKRAVIAAVTKGWLFAADWNQTKELGYLWRTHSKIAGFATLILAQTATVKPGAAAGWAQPSSRIAQTHGEL